MAERPTLRNINLDKIRVVPFERGDKVQVVDAPGKTWTVTDVDYNEYYMTTFVAIEDGDGLDETHEAQYLQLAD